MEPHTGTQSIERALNLLKTLGTRGKAGWRITDLATHTKLDDSTVHRIMTCLSSMRYARKKSSNRHYVPGPLLYELSATMPSYFRFQAICHKSLSKICQKTGGVAYLYLRADNESVCIGREGSTRVRLVDDIGVRKPLLGSSLGVAMLLALPESEQTRIISANTAALKEGPPRRYKGSERMWRRSQEFGAGICLGDIVSGIGSVAVPILNTDKRPVAAIGVRAPLVELSPTRVVEVRRVLEQEARWIESNSKHLLADISAD